MATLRPEHAAYLETRGIRQATVEIGGRSITARQGEPLIQIPYPKGFCKTYEVGSPDPWRQRKRANTRLSLFNEDRIDFSRTWILTEGEFDALTAIEHGYKNTASLPDGAVQPKEETPAKSGKLWAIRNAWPKIQAGGGNVILALDNDAPGDITRDTLIEIFGRWRCLTVDYPAHDQATGQDGKCKDLNEVWKLLGPNGVRRTIETARPIKLEGVFKPSEIKRRPPRVYYSTGLPGMDEHIKLFPGELCVWTGHTAAGKSTALMSVLGSLAKQGLKVGYAAFEADYHEDILPWFNVWLHGEAANAETEELTNQWLEENFVFISHEIEPLQAQASAEWMIQQAQDAKGRFGIDVLAVDPWNKLQHKRRHGESETDYIGRALAEFRNFASAYSVIGIVAAHPTKDSGKEGEVPTEFDIHGSMNWGNAADHVVVIHRPNKKYTTTLAKVAKSRFKKGGIAGEKWLTYSSLTNLYSPCDPSTIPDEVLGKDKKAKKNAKRY